jgi:RNA-directed DNA polymerase
MLSNIYLHAVLDRWFEEEIKPQLQGKAALVRFADDFVVVCAERVDAESLLGQIRERFAAYGLTIHPEKTRIVDFRHPWKSERKPQTFDFLGFTHYWGKTRKGGFAVKRKTQGKKFRAALQRVEEWCKKNRHRELREQHSLLCAKLQGHYAYYGIRGNSRSLANYWHMVKQRWHYWLMRRSRQRHNSARLWQTLHEHFTLPRPRIVHGQRPDQLQWSFVS